MIREHFGLDRSPFAAEQIDLLEHQQTVLDMLMVHAQQGGLCLVLGEPGTGKSVIKRALMERDPKRMVTPVVNRTLHTYSNTLRILCDAFQVEYDGGRDCYAEKMLVQHAFKLYRGGKMLVPIIDDAHLMPAESLRKLRLLFEDFPRTHNLVLIALPQLLHTLTLAVNEEIRSRVTYSVVLKRLAPDAVHAFLLDQFTRAGLGHHVFTEDALALIVRSADGLMRRARNIALGALVEAVRDRTRTVGLDQVNHVLTQPHYRKEYDEQIA